MSVDRNFNVWDGVYRSFAEAPAVGPGFDGAVAHERGVAAAYDIRASLDAGKPLDYSLRQRNALLPVVVAAVLTQQDKARVLDFGGGLGSGYLVLLKTVPQTHASVEYNVVEVEGICRAGAQLFAGGKGPVFLPALPDGIDYDLVHTASAMQYIEDWRTVVARLAGYGAPFMVFADAFVGPFASFVTLQNYYGSRIRHWFLNADEFIDEVCRHGYELAARLDCDARILGTYGPLPMQNFPPKLQLPHSSNLLFRSKRREI
jgi:putative methyltransferase (TIGR04325 family)